MLYFIINCYISLFLKVSLYPALHINKFLHINRGCLHIIRVHLSAKPLYPLFYLVYSSGTAPHFPRTQVQLFIWQLYTAMHIKSEGQFFAVNPSAFGLAAQTSCPPMLQEQHVVCTFMQSALLLHSSEPDLFWLKVLLGNTARTTTKNSAIIAIALKKTPFFQPISKNKFPC